MERSASVVTKMARGMLTFHPASRYSASTHPKFLTEKPLQPRIRASQWRVTFAMSVTMDIALVAGVAASGALGKGPGPPSGQFALR